jgi:hypothetical protein
MKIFVVVAVFFGLASSGLQARIGETPEQVAARLGEPVARTGEQGVIGAPPAGSQVLTYQKDRYKIVVVFYQGVSQMEMYMKGGLPISDDEAEAILANNSFTGKWEPEGSAADYSQWRWNGDQMTAVSSKLGALPYFMIRTARYEKAAQEADVEVAKQSAAAL